MELLWTNVARNRRNIVPVLDFLVAHGYTDSNAGQGLQASACCLLDDRTAHCSTSSLQPHGKLEVQAVDAQLTVPKRVVLFLARASPDVTIDHLVGEASRLIYEDASEALPASAVGRALPLPTASGASTAATPRTREKVGQNRIGAASSCHLIVCKSLSGSDHRALMSQLTDDLNPATEMAPAQVLEFSDEAAWPAPELVAAPWPDAASQPVMTSRRGSQSISVSRASSSLSTRHHLSGVPSGIPSVATALERVRHEDKLSPHACLRCAAQPA